MVKRNNRDSARANNTAHLSSKRSSQQRDKLSAESVKPPTPSIVMTGTTLTTPQRASSGRVVKEPGRLKDFV